MVADCPHKRDDDKKMKNKKNKKKKKKKKKDKKEKKVKKMTFKKTRREVAMWSLGIVMAQMIVMMIQAMMRRRPSRRLLQASLFTTI
jgi:Na+/glutamate symporter